MIRNKVLWHGCRQGREDDLEFSRRDLILETIDDEPLGDPSLIGARGIVYSIGDAGVARAVRHLERNASCIVDHGLWLGFLTLESAVTTHVEKELVQLGVPKSAVKLLEGDSNEIPDYQIAQLFARHDPKLGWKQSLDLEFGPETEPLDTPDERLIRRAFSDCTHIRITRLGEGRTAETYMVQAVFAGKSIAPRPLPFFVKLGERSKIMREQDSYRDYANFFIPFHLRPNLDPNRCLFGLRRGILVGNFVERARSLWTAVEEGKASAAIDSLFDVTLAGWWAQGLRSDGRVRQGSVAGKLTDSIFNYEKVKPEIEARARTLGLQSAPKELWLRLIGCRWQGYYEGPMHGDLHPDNVFVRGGDAILIDLGSVQPGPLSGDPACLETSLTFETRKEDESLHFAKWRDDIDKLYAPEALGQIPPLLDGAGAWANRWNAARQVRELATRTHSGSEYAAAIAVYLLRRSMYGPHSEVDEEVDVQHRAYAMVAAERLVAYVEQERS